MVCVFGSLLLLLGCGLVTARRLLIIDTRARVITTAWGWLCPGSRELPSISACGSMWWPDRATFAGMEGNALGRPSIP